MNTSLIEPPRGGNKYINIAARKAMQSPSKYKMGAVIVRGGHIKAIAFNGRHENEHAELRAINKAGDISGATIYIVRVRPNGHFGMARPCPMCWLELKQAGVKLAVWSTDNELLDSNKIVNSPWEDLRLPVLSCFMELPISYRLMFQPNREIDAA